VSCQNERSQPPGTRLGDEVLKARLYDIKMKENQAKLDQISGVKKDSASAADPQLRVHPYQMARTRTKERSATSTACSTATSTPS